jgi:hypothetical protein
VPPSIQLAPSNAASSARIILVVSPFWSHAADRHSILDFPEVT